MENLGNVQESFERQEQEAEINRETEALGSARAVYLNTSHLMNLNETDKLSFYLLDKNKAHFIMDDAVICIQFMDYTDWKVKMLLNIEDIETALNSDNISTFIKKKSANSL